MQLHDVWFVLIAVLWTGYFFLEGFDFGIGVLTKLLARGPHRAAGPDQHHRARLGRQRGVAAHAPAARPSPPSPTGTPPSSPASTCRCCSSWSA